MALKTLLVAMTTMRILEGNAKAQRVRFPAKSVVDLTEAELSDLDKLQVSTGKLHYRSPITEGGKPVESKPEIVSPANQSAFDGSKVEVADKTVKQLKAYLDFHKIEYADNATKPALLALASTHSAQADNNGGAGTIQDDDNEADEDNGGGGDPDAGL